jgi:autotransporter strand-loop-strand O-heptosyltransferase
MGKHYDFIEIGTSDFDTLIENADDNTIGLSIEPIKFYLDRLPDKKNVTKVNAAISEYSGFIDIYHIEEDKIIENNLPYWVRGCNSVDKPHEYVVNKIGKDLYDKIVTKTRVIKMDWYSLVDMFNIEGITHLKIDTEGHDHIILESYLNQCNINPKLLADTIEFECNEISNKEAIDNILLKIQNIYNIDRRENDIFLNKKKHEHEKAYVLYADDSYFDLVDACCRSIRNFSTYPIYVYMLNSDNKVEVENTITIRWDCDVKNSVKRKDYIDRADKDIYKLLIERPKITKDALINYADTVAYIDTDSVASPYVDRIFDFYDYNSTCPYFVEGVYDYLHINGRGGADSRDDLSTTLEHPACDLFGINQYVRERYRQTGYYVAGQKTIDFLDEWYWMCNHPKILANHEWYAPYHEETIMNVLLYKRLVFNGLPCIYVNGLHNNLEFTGEARIDGNWLRIPAKKEDLLFYHGEKNIDKINLFIGEKKMRILYLAPHLSTGGMPQFLLKRIEALKDYTDCEIYVVEYQCYSLDFVVQRDKIKSLLGENFTTLYEDKMELFKVIDKWKPDLIHIDEPSERLDREMIKQLYNTNRKYRIAETCHDVSFDPDKEKIFHPDSYIFCSPYHEQTFANMESTFVTIEYPIDKKEVNAVKDGKHVLNVGLWTSGKNQGEGIEIARKYPNMTFHFVGNQAGNFKDYWEPLMKDLPSNVKVWGERKDIDTFMEMADIFMFNSTWECNPLVLREAISYGLPIIARNLPQYGDMFTNYLQPIDSDLNTLECNYEVPTDNTTPIFAFRQEDAYKKIIELPIQKQKVSISQHFVDNPFLEIKGNVDSKFKVQFFDGNGSIIYENIINSNTWVKLNRTYFTNWTTKVWEGNEMIYANFLHLNNKRVFIVIESKSLGDTLAWVPYALEFQKLHQCKVILSTFWNRILHYPELELVEPGIVVNNVYALYRIGWFYNSDKEPEIPNTIPLQKAATNILGLDFTEQRPVLAYTPVKFESAGKFVTIATNSTSGCKFWTKEGWQELINYLVSQNYLVYNVSKEKNPFDNCVQIEDTSIENTINMISNSKFFIGLSSGLSWLAWALNVKVFMISNFTEADHEFTDCVRITNTNVCHGCWNEEGIIFDKGDWNWCKHKGTDKHFECHKSITAQMVIEKIKAAF